MDQPFWNVAEGSLPGCPTGSVVSLITDGRSARVMRQGVGQVATLIGDTTDQTSGPDGSIILTNAAEGWRAVLTRATVNTAPATFAYCVNCGAPLPANAQFCAACGTRVSGEAAPTAPPLAAPPQPIQPAIIVDQRGGPRRLWIGLGIVIFVAIVAAAGFIALAGSGSLTPHHTIAGTFELVVSDQTFPSIKMVGSDCQGTGGYGDIDEGTQVTLKDGDGKILGTAQLGAGTGGTSDCTFPFSIPNVPEVPFYSVEVANRGQVTDSLAQIEADNWAFGLTLGK